MQRTLIKELPGSVGKLIGIAGWVDVRRDHGKLIFLDVRDRSGIVQVVVTPKAAEALEAARELRPQWVIRIEGEVKSRPENMRSEGALGAYELVAQKIEVLSKADVLPFELGTEINIDTHLDLLPLTVRSERARDIFLMQETLIDGFRSGLRAQGFTEFQAPALVGGDAEGGAAAFSVDYYYEKKAFLATSPQFYKQIMVGAFERVFATPKVFRGEKHSTTRHLSEYSSMDFEMGFIKDHTDVMAILENVVRGIVARVSKDHADLLKRFNTTAPLLPEEIPVLKLREAQKILGVTEAPDLEPEHERAICDWAKKEKGSDFVFITHYPVSKRPFYTYEDEEDPGFTNSFDLLFRGLEITTGGQRVHNHAMLVKRIEERGMKPEQFSYYLQAFKYGMPPHGGSATGLERITARTLELQNVKEATLFPRDLNRIDVRLTQ
ncbi:aspartate--tRNA(Asn) ligase [Candidatus Kaiserbacteria bacterium]|nr:aspartate--tRNA(Asn) ligase [Candidatus Kaiserbacteria bacterium]